MCGFDVSCKTLLAIRICVREQFHGDQFNLLLAGVCNAIMSDIIDFVDRENPYRRYRKHYKCNINWIKSISVACSIWTKIYL